MLYQAVHYSVSATCCLCLPHSGESPCGASGAWRRERWGDGASTACCRSLPQTNAGRPRNARDGARAARASERDSRRISWSDRHRPSPMLSTAATNASAGTMFLSREQYLFNVFEVLVSTLESKLQRIENLDRAVEHLMRRVETLDGKADAVMARLRALSLPTTGNAVEARLAALDRKVSAMDAKLGSIRQSLDAPEDIIGAAASEKKATVVDAGAAAAAAVAAVPKALSGQLDALRSASSAVDRKLQFHINVVSESLGRALALLRDVHAAVVEAAPANNTASKLDRLARQMGPVLSVSDKMAEVWDVVVGTKSSVDGLVPAADKLLTQTQRQERALSDAHADLRNKANEIIANLDLVERRLQQAPLVSGPASASASAPATGFLPPSLVPPQDLAAPYDVELTTPAPEVPATTLPPPPPPQPVAPSTPAPTTTPSTTTSTTAAAAASAASSSLSSARATTRSRNVIFPSVKNKPTLANTSFTTDALQGIKDVKGYSCLDLQNAGMRDSGVYYLQIRGTTYWFLKVFCEQDAGDGGWTVIQRRDDFGEPRENFNRDWNDYKNGFGDPAREFWLGNENIYMLTNNEEYMLRVELEDFEGNKRYAQYTHFKIYSEAEYYKLEIDGYDGNAGDSLNDPWYGSHNSPFSTYNRDNDRSSLNCASMLKGGWWWKSCGRGLNGLYLNDPQDLTARQGIVWFRWRGWDYTLKKAVMMIKPRGNIKGEGAANAAS